MAHGGLAYITLQKPRPLPRLKLPTPVCLNFPTRKFVKLTVAAAVDSTKFFQITHLHFYSIWISQSVGNSMFGVMSSLVTKLSPLSGAICLQSYKCDGGDGEPFV